MTQPTPTFEKLNGVEVANYFYPEHKYSIAEYHDGLVLIQVTHGQIGPISVNARFDHSGDQQFGIHNNTLDFEELHHAYLKACERHGARPQKINDLRDFYFLNNGHAVLWSDGTAS